MPCRLELLASASHEPPKSGPAINKAICRQMLPIAAGWYTLRGLEVSAGVRCKTDPCERSSMSTAEATGVPLSTSDSAEQLHQAEETIKGTLGSFGSPAMASPPVKQQLDFDLGIKREPDTPSTPAVHTPAPAVKEEAGEVDYVQFVNDVLQWTNAVRSGFYLVAGVAGILLMDNLVMHNAFVTIVCYITIAQMALNFVRHVISPSMQQKATWLDSAWTHAAINGVGTSLKTLAALHDKHLSADSPHKHLLIALSLWILSLACAWISPATLALAIYVGAFVIPKVYVMNRKVIDPKATDLFNTAKVKFEAADRRIKAAVIMVLILALGLVSTTDFIIAIFIICLFVNSQLPKEMEGLSKKAAPVLTPIGKTAANVSGHLGKALNSAAVKYELTPTPKKKKQN